jgi:hypothetical protein
MNGLNEKIVVSKEISEDVSEENFEKIEIL